MCLQAEQALPGDSLRNNKQTSSDLGVGNLIVLHKVLHTTALLSTGKSCLPLHALRPTWPAAEFAGSDAHVNPVQLQLKTL